MTIVIDTVQSPPVDAMRAAGVEGVCRYLSWVQPNTDFKRINAAEYQMLLAASFVPVLNWEYDSRDWMGGAIAGHAQGAEAVRQAKALGYPAGCVIPGSADFDMTINDWNAAAGSYAFAYAQEIHNGGFAPGVYGAYDVLTWCHDAGWYAMYWQAGMSTAWSASRGQAISRAHWSMGRNSQPWPGAHLRQRRHIIIGGIDCDANDILRSDYAQPGGSVVLTQQDIDAVAAAVKTSVGGGAFSLTIDQLSGWLATGRDPRDPKGPATGAPSLQGVLDAISKAGTLSITDAQVQALTTAVVAAVVAAHDALTDADKPVIQAAAADAIRSVLGALG